MNPQIIGDGRCIRLGRGVFIRRGARIETVVRFAGETFSPKLYIGDHTNIEQDVHIVCAGEVTIGANVSITGRCAIVDVDHYLYNDPEQPHERERINVMPVRIGDHTVVGMNSIILPGTTIGEHCVIGANSVVRGNIPPRTVWVGAPAKCVRRWDETTRTWVLTRAASQQFPTRRAEVGSSS